MDPEDLPYNSAWEIPRNHVVLGRIRPEPAVWKEKICIQFSKSFNLFVCLGQVLGSCSAGRIVEATVSALTGSDSTTKAAVKIMKCTVHLLILFPYRSPESD